MAGGVLNGGEGPTGLPPDAAPALERARRDYLRSLIADLPKPEDFIWHLPFAVINALVGAWQSNQGCWRVESAAAEECSRWGVVEVQGPYLTAFGMAVRRALKAEAERDPD